MNRLKLFLLLSKNNRLAMRRNPAYEQSMVAKIMMFVGGGMMGAYLIFFAVLFSSLANKSAEPAMWLLIMPLLMAIDFGTRFVTQATPLMLVKPYVLLPLPCHSVIETFLLTSLFSGYNLLWLCFLLPYCFIIFCGCASFGTTLAVLLSGSLIVMINSQWYLLVRTLTQRNILWWLLPIAVYAAYFAPLLLSADSNDTTFETVMETVTELGATWWFVALCALLLVAFCLLNRWMQSRYVYEELSRQEKKEANLKKVSQFTYLERFGLTGEYLKLELKAAMRCKAVKMRVITSLVLIAVLSLIIAYTDMYDGRMMLSFWCYYCFSLYALSTLAKVMGPEGNYIDLLMVHRESILSLLRAKYYFHVGVLFIPLLLMLPAIIAGKFSLLMILAYMSVTSGLLLMVMFQLAVYNKQTLPLDQKITGKGNVENGIQTLIVFASMLAPIALLSIFILLFSEEAAYWTLLIVGLAFFVAHPLWLRNIYSRMMKRKYVNLEGFHATR